MLILIPLLPLHSYDFPYNNKFLPLAKWALGIFVKIKINSQEFVYQKSWGLGLNYTKVILALRTDSVHSVFSAKALHVFHKLIREKKPMEIQNIPFLG